MNALIARYLLCVYAYLLISQHLHLTVCRIHASGNALTAPTSMRSTYGIVLFATTSESSNLNPTRPYKVWRQLLFHWWAPDQARLTTLFPCHACAACCTESNSAMHQPAVSHLLSQGLLTQTARATSSRLRRHVAAQLRVLQAPSVQQHQTGVDSVTAMYTVSIPTATTTVVGTKSFAQRP